MICNQCLNRIQRNTQIYGNTQCDSIHNNGIHIYCNSCFNKLTSSRSDSCPCKMCKTTLSKNAMFPLRGNPFSTLDQLPSNIINSLCGYHPEIINEIAGKAIKFWNKQNQYQMLKYRQLQQKQQKMIQQLRLSLGKHKKAIQSLKTQNQNEITSHQRTRTELTQKCQTQMKQTQNLKQMALKYKNGYSQKLRAIKTYDTRLKNANSQYQRLQNEHNKLKQQLKQRRTPTKRRRSSGNTSASHTSSQHSHGSRGIGDPHSIKRQRRQSQESQHLLRNHNDKQRLTQQTVPQTEYDNNNQYQMQMVLHGHKHRSPSPHRKRKRVKNKYFFCNTIGRKTCTN